MAPLVLCRMHYAIIPLYSEWKLRQIVVIETIAGDLLPFGELAEVLMHFLQAVAKHDKFIGCQWALAWLSKVAIYIFRRENEFTQDEQEL
jgi:hypothetical protein